MREGACLGGKYSLGTLLGEGACGRVYEAYQLALRRRVVVKVLRPRWAGDERLVRQFQREAEAGARVRHPNVVTVLDFGCEEGAWYCVMEHLEGTSLGRLAWERSFASWGEVARLFSEVAGALTAIHGAGVVHGDVKPDNVLVRNSDRAAVLIDFGLARLAGERISQRSRIGDPDGDEGPSYICGTPSYMAPEVILGEPVGESSDIYGAGALLYELLTGGPPFLSTGDGRSVLAKHLREPVTPPSERRPDAEIPPYLETIAMRALDKRPSSRHSSAAALFHDASAAAARLGAEEGHPGRLAALHQGYTSAETERDLVPSLYPFAAASI